MAGKKERELAEILGISFIDKGGPMGGTSAVGPVDGYPVAVAWTKREKQATVGILMKIRAGSLKLPAEEALEQLYTNEKVLEAMGKNKPASGERKASSLHEDGLVLFWDYSLKSPSIEKVTGLIRTLVEAMGSLAKPPEGACDLCESGTNARLHCIDGELLLGCSSCMDRLKAEDMEAERQWGTVESRPLFGTAAGLVTAAVLGIVWGLIAIFTQRIWVILAIGIGLAVAFSVSWAMRKVNLYGKVIGLALPVFSVLLGDFMHIVHLVSLEFAEPMSLDLASRVLPLFWEIELSDSSGYLSIGFGLLGGIIALSTLKPKTVARTVIPIPASL